MVVELREAHLDEMANLAGALHSMLETAARAAICSREKASRQFRQLRSILNPSVSSGLDRIDVPNAFAVLREGEEAPRIPLVVKSKLKRFLFHIPSAVSANIKKPLLGPDRATDT